MENDLIFLPLFISHLVTHTITIIIMLAIINIISNHYAIYSIFYLYYQRLFYINMDTLIKFNLT